MTEEAEQVGGGVTGTGLLQQMAASASAALSSVTTVTSTKHAPDDAAHSSDDEDPSACGHPPSHAPVLCFWLCLLRRRGQ
jgi:hypothetical protein